VASGGGGPGVGGGSGARLRGAGAGLADAAGPPHGGFGAGGGTDIAARIVAQPLTEILGQAVVVENRVGAGGITAANAVATAPPDGYTMLMVSNAHAIAPVIYKSVPYDSVKDFEMISMVGTAGLIMVTHPDFPAKNLP